MFADRRSDSTACHPRAIQLADYTSQTVALLAADPVAQEILVERVKMLRPADSVGNHGEVFARLNPSA